VGYSIHVSCCLTKLNWKGKSQLRFTENQTYYEDKRIGVGALLTF